MIAWEPPQTAQPRTSLRIVDGQGIHWGSHLARLRLGAAKLGWDVSWLDEVEPEIGAWIATTDSAICRFQLFADVVSVRLEAIPELFPHFRLIALPHPLGDIREDAMASHKGLLGAWDIQARNHAKAKVADDALLIWPDGSIAETTIAAIGLQIDGSLLMPPLDGRVSSITEAFELPHWAISHGLDVQHRPIRLDEVSGGQLWCMNAVRGLWQAEMVQL